MNFGFIDTDYIFRTALVFLRVGAILFALPIFGDSTVPVRIRMFLSVAIALITTPLLSGAWLAPVNTNPLILGMLVIKEVALGLTLGLAVRISFDAILLGSSMIAYQMGFGAANLIAPGTDMNTDPFTALQRLIYILIFITLNLHHLFLLGIIESFKIIPPGGFSINPELADSLIKASSAMFGSALQIAAPITVALLFTTATLGLMARAVPALNVFSLSFAVNFMVGLMLYIASMSFYTHWLSKNYNSQAQGIFSTIQLLAPRGI